MMSPVDSRFDWDSIDNDLFGDGPRPWPTLPRRRRWVRPVTEIAVAFAVVVLLFGWWKVSQPPDPTLGPLYNETTTTETTR